MEVINIASLFPRFVNKEFNEELNMPVMMGEPEVGLKWFKKDKSHGPDGWPVQFSLAFLI